MCVLKKSLGRKKLDPEKPHPPCNLLFVNLHNAGAQSTLDKGNSNSDKDNLCNHVKDGLKLEGYNCKPKESKE